MAAGQFENDSQSYILSPDMTPGLYDGTSGESSAGSPVNCSAGFESIYGTNVLLSHSSFPTVYPVHHEGYAPAGLIPVELDIQGMHDDYDRRRKKGSGEKTVSPHVHSRRRAQNRASQRAFRDRKEKRMKDLEAKLADLETRHSDLSKSYDSLQIEYSSVKQELENLTREKMKEEASPNDHLPDDWDICRTESLDPLLFDVSTFCYDHGETEDRK